MRGWRLVGLVTIVLALASADVAMAAPGDPGEPDVHTVPASLTVTAPSAGLVTGRIGSDPNIIACPGDCSESLDYLETCEAPRGCTSDASTVRLTANRGAGWEADWTGCTPQAPNVCDVRVTGHQTVSLTWVDTAPPSISWEGTPPSVVGPFGIVARASDNAGPPTVTFFVDNVEQPASLVTSTSSGQYLLRLALAQYAHGSQHAVRAVARDGAGRETPLASHTFTVDKAVGFTMEPVAAHVQAIPTIRFTKPADVSLANCEIFGTSAFELDYCTSPWTPRFNEGEPLPDRLYSARVTQWDQYGNREERTLSFTLDRGAPNLTLTSPATGAMVTAPFTPTSTTSDALTPTASIVRTCRIDDGSFGSCSSLAPSDGPHTLTMRARDLAGNTTDRSVDFTYDANAPQAEITEGPVEGALVRTRSVAFAFSGTDATALTVACKVDGGSFGACSADRSHTIDGLNPGIHQFTVRFTDAAGHTTELTRQFVTDDPLPAGRDGADGAAGTPGTTTPGGGGNTPSALPVVAARTTAKFSVRAARTIVKKLTVTGLARGATVEVSCKGKGCPRGTTKFTSRRAALSLTSVFKKRTLRPGAVIEVRVTQAGHTGRVFRYTTQKGKKKPKAETLTVP